MADEEEIVIRIRPVGIEPTKKGLEHLGIEYDKLKAKTKNPINLGDSLLTAKNFSVGAKGLDALGNAAEKAGKKAETAQKNFLTFDRVIAALGISKVVSTFVELSDTYTNMQNKLATVTNGQADLAYVTQQLSGIAEETRMPMSDLVAIYQRTQRATEGLGKSQAETFQFAENLSKAIKLSGATTAEASSAIIQLSQAMSLGKLKGQDLNSILSFSPVVAKLIADKMGVATKELKALGSEGKITTEIVFDAIKDAAEKVDAPFAKMSKTIG
jgi:tape measure domain-containing protein